MCLVDPSCTLPGMPVFVPLFFVLLGEGEYGVFFFYLYHCFLFGFILDIYCGSCGYKS